MRSTILNLFIIFGIVLATFFGTREYYPKVIDRTTVDTVRVDVPYETVKIKEVEKPVKVIEYRTDTIEVEKVRIERDTVFVDTDLNTFAYNTRFLTAYPLAPRFLGLQFANDELELTYQSTDGEVQGKTWNASQGYRVGLDNGQPNIETFDESTEFMYSVEVGYIRFFSYGSVYFEVSSEFNILGVDVTGTVNANRNPYAKIGIKHTF